MRLLNSLDELHYRVGLRHTPEGQTGWHRPRRQSGRCHEAGASRHARRGAKGVALGTPVRTGDESAYRAVGSEGADSILGRSGTTDPDIRCIGRQGTKIAQVAAKHISVRLGERNDQGIDG